MDVKDGYKLTEVGVIPRDWDVVVLSEVAELASGHTPSRRQPTYWGGDIPWISLHDVSRLEDANFGKTAYSITAAGLANSSARLLPPGTVVFSRTATIGRCLTLHSAATTSQDFANYICGPKVHGQYLVYLFVI